MKHKLIITYHNKSNGFVIREVVEEFLSLYNAERRLFDLECYHEETNKHTDPSDIMAKFKLITVEQQRKAA